MTSTLADTVVLEGSVTPEDIRTCLIEAVNYGWQVHGADGRCNVPANFVGWLLQENERLRAAAARYQYLRSRPDDTIGKGGVFAGMTPPTGAGGSILTEEDLDCAVDAALLHQDHGK